MYGITLEADLSCELETLRTDLIQHRTRAPSSRATRAMRSPIGPAPITTTVSSPGDLGPPDVMTGDGERLCERCQANDLLVLALRLRIVNAGTVHDVWKAPGVSMPRHWRPRPTAGRSPYRLPFRLEHPGDALLPGRRR